MIIWRLFKIENCQLLFFRLILRSLFPDFTFLCRQKQSREYIYMSAKMFIISRVCGFLYVYSMFGELIN